jgi:hypothetical protein
MTPAELFKSNNQEKKNKALEHIRKKKDQDLLHKSLIRT